MKKADRELRIQIMLELEHEQTQPKRWIWLSFVNEDDFAGVVITKTHGLNHAIQKTHLLGINPGGEVMSYELDDDDRRYQPYSDRLLSKADLADAGFEPVSINEALDR